MDLNVKDTDSKYISKLKSKILNNFDSLKSKHIEKANEIAIYMLAYGDINESIKLIESFIDKPIKLDSGSKNVDAICYSLLILSYLYEQQDTIVIENLYEKALAQHSSIGQGEDLAEYCEFLTNEMKGTVSFYQENGSINDILGTYYGYFPLFLELYFEHKLRGKNGKSQSLRAANQEIEYIIKQIKEITGTFN